jgi:hypothetical protein
MEIRYARVPTTKQDLDRQIDALLQEGIAAGQIYGDKKSAANTNRPGLHAALDQAREGDVIVADTLDRLDRRSSVPTCSSGSRRIMSGVLTTMKRILLFLAPRFAASRHYWWLSPRPHCCSGRFARTAFAAWPRQRHFSSSNRTY